MKTLIFVAVIFALSACSPNKKEIHKTINQDEFPGLSSLGNSYEEVKLSYDLDNKDGELIHFSNCMEIENTNGEDVKEDQYQLLNLMKLNCQALKLYFEATGSTSSSLPASPSIEFIRDLPANAIPDQGGNTKKMEGSLGESQAGLTEIAVKANSVEVQFADLDVNYVILAKGDFNQNGVEDMLLRMDWRVSSAFGSGFGLLVVEVNDGDAQVIERY